MAVPELDFAAILTTLSEHGVDFIVVGGVGAVLQGAPVSTFDIDLVHSLDDDNVDRLLRALAVLDARYRGRPDVLRPERSQLSSPGHQLLMTTAGPLDLLGSIGNRSRYEDLIGSAVDLLVLSDLTVKVLDLEKLIEIKEQTGRDKDKATLPILRQTLRERR